MCRILSCCIRAKEFHNWSGLFGRSGVGISRCDGSMVCSVEVMVCHMRGKAIAGVPVMESIASRSLMAKIKLLICRIGSRD